MADVQVDSERGNPHHIRMGRWIFALLLVGCSVDVGEQAAQLSGPCLDRELLRDELHRAAEADGMPATETCCRNWYEWVSEERAEWYLAQCAEYHRLTDECMGRWDCG